MTLQRAQAIAQGNGGIPTSPADMRAAAAKLREKPNRFDRWAPVLDREAARLESIAA